MLKEKFLYLTQKVKELMGFGGPVTSVNLEGAHKLNELNGAANIGINETEDEKTNLTENNIEDNNSDVDQITTENAPVA